MLLIDGRLRWGAADLALQTRCEYSLLRSMDEALGRVPSPPASGDAWKSHMAALRSQHRAEVVRRLRAQGRPVVAGVDGSLAALDDAEFASHAADTRRRLAQGAPTVMVRPVLAPGDFADRPDLLASSASGWVVGEATLSFGNRKATTTRLGAFALALEEAGARLAPRVVQHLPHGEQHHLEMADALEELRGVRAELRRSIAARVDATAPVEWGQVRGCGWCARCKAAIERLDDLRLVSGLRGELRQVFVDAGVDTMTQLATLAEAPDGVGEEEFARLHTQARLQVAHRAAGPGAELTFELAPGSERAWQMLPPADDADLFFDFEGDPFHDEGAPGRRGLQYLWGWEDATRTYASRWVDDWAGERATFEWFVDMLTERRRLHPGMHVLHYASYETDALREMAQRYGTRREELKVLISEGVFVDLYAVVRAGVIVSTASYSIKRLEPLYLGDDLRADHGVQAGDDSILVLHQMRAAQAEGRDQEAARLRADLTTYNAHDCRSTRGLRDWLALRAEEFVAVP